MDILDKINESAAYIKAKLPYIPEIAVILGSGLGPIADEIQNPIVMDYKDIPNFRASTVAGHAGKLIAGEISGKKVLVMSGRFHYYEGNPMEIVTLPVRVFKKLGINSLIVTNAAGGVGDNVNPGSIMIINDHLSFCCPSPLLGPNLDEFGPRFKDMTEIYTKKRRILAHEVAASLGIDVCEGVYCYSKGPQYESPAEIRALKVLGADAVGMSTVPECIVARHCGMEILGFSVCTNKAAGLSAGELSHEEVSEIANQVSSKIVALVKGVIKAW